MRVEVAFALVANERGARHDPVRVGEGVFAGDAFRQRSALARWADELSVEGFCLFSLRCENVFAPFDRCERHRGVEFDVRHSVEILPVGGSSQ